MKKLIALAAVAALTTTAFAMSKAPEKGCCGTCSVKEACEMKDGSCSVEGKACGMKQKASCELKDGSCKLEAATEKEGCANGTCPLSK